jgi:hypothetical protein
VTLGELPFLALEWIAVLSKSLFQNLKGDEQRR